MRRVLLIGFLLMTPVLLHAQDVPLPATDEYVRAKVIELSPERSSEFAGIERQIQDAQLQILDGPDAGQSIEFENGILNNRADMRLVTGETIVMQRLVKPDGAVSYLARDKYRLPPLLFLTVFFFALGVVLAGRIGFTSILGLLASIAVLVFFVVPLIIKGYNPLLISFIGAMLIACTSIYLAHGFNRRTSIALVSTIITLGFSLVLAVIFVHVSKLFGMGTEESVFLQLGPLQAVNLRGLLLGGILIGALGVLDDITTAQTAAVDELSKANHAFGFTELYHSATSIGREHIAALINTLALAYVGASLPLFLLFYINTDTPWWVILNGEFLAEEIVRTLVGSATLLLAVPISTWLAARSFAHGNHTNVGGHGHVH